MSENWLIVLERLYARSARPELLNLPHDYDPVLVAELLRAPAPRRRGVRGSGRTARPAWQSPYGPPPHRAHRGRWAPVPVLVRPRPALRRGFVCGRCE